uniref:Uncharacterized protein n=1 Tax=Naja naja TaxID=35670 RepID=A0A8C6XKW4_NAJNA
MFPVLLCLLVSSAVLLADPVPHASFKLGTEEVTWLTLSIWTSQPSTVSIHCPVARPVCSMNWSGPRRWLPSSSYTVTYSRWTCCFNPEGCCSAYLSFFSTYQLVPQDNVSEQNLFTMSSKAAIFNCTRDCECIQHNLTCTKGDTIQGTTTTSCKQTTGKFLNAHMCQVIGMIVTQANATWAVNKSLPLYLGKVWWLCGHNAYPEIPGGWFETCALGWVSPAVWVNQSLPRGLRLRNKREVPSLDSGLTLGGSWSTQLARGLQPNLGAAMNYRDLHKLNNWTTHMFNFTIKTLKANNQEMQEIRTVVLQNRYALDYLLAAKGGVCALLGAMCCTYIHDNGPNITHTIQHMEDMIKHNPLVTPAEENAMDIWGALWSWLPSGWMAGFVKILILVAGLLVGVCCCLQLGVTHPENLVSAYFIS